MREARQTIGLFGCFGTGNFGNDGSLEAMLNFLRTVRPDTNLVCICADPDVIATTYGVRSFPISSGRPTSTAGRLARLLMKLPDRVLNWPRSIRVMRQLDLLIIPGTGILDDFATGPFGVPYALFRWCLAARLSRVPIAFVSIGAGPIHHPLSRWFMKTALRMAHYRSYRDEISKAYMRSIGFDSRQDPVFPDLANKLPSPPLRQQRLGRGEPLTVGVGVMAYYGWSNDSRNGVHIHESYLEKISMFAHWLLEQGHHVRILMGESTDQRTVVALKDKLLARVPFDLGARLSAEPTGSLHELMLQMTETDVVVATRFHNVVCALKVGRPTISIGYAKKNQVLLDEVGLGHFCQTVDHLDVDRLKEQFTALLRERGRHERAIREVNLRHEQQLRRQDEILIAELL